MFPLKLVACCLFISVTGISQIAKPESFSKSTLMLLSSEADKFFAPKDTVRKISGWTKGGIITAILNQSSFSNWAPGGENNFALTITANYNLNYIKGRNTWNIRLTGNYGFSKSGNSRFFKTTADFFEVNAIRGYRIARNFYYSGFSNLRSQFDIGYTYSKDANNVEIRKEFTRLFSPAYLKIGIGLLWRKDDNLRVNFSPFAFNQIFVNSSYTLPNKAYFGVPKGSSYRSELGLNVEVYYLFSPMKNVTLQNIFILYSEYGNSDNTDIDYRLQAVMKINKVLSTNFTLQTVYDDDSFKGAFQIRQLWGLGLNYTL